MGKKFATTTTVRNPETGETVWFNPGEDCPDWADEVVDNPAAFMQEDVDSNDDVDYNSMTVPQLVELAKTRGLEPESTKKHDLVALLEGNGAGD